MHASQLRSRIHSNLPHERSPTTQRHLCGSCPRRIGWWPGRPRQYDIGTESNRWGVEELEQSALAGSKRAAEMVDITSKTAELNDRLWMPPMAAFSFNQAASRSALVFCWLANARSMHRSDPKTPTPFHLDHPTHAHVYSLAPLKTHLLRSYGNPSMTPLRPSPATGRK